MARIDKKQAHERREKETRQMISRLNQIHRLKQRAAPQKLEKPIFWGYKRFFVVKRTTDARLRALYNSILPIVQDVWYSRDRLFDTPMIMHHKVLYYMFRPDRRPQLPKELVEDAYNTLSDSQKELFIKTAHYNKWTGQLYYRYLFIKPEVLEFRIKKHYITEERVYDAALDSEQALLERKINDNRLGMKLDHPSQRERKRKGRERQWKNDIFEESLHQ